MKKNPYHHFTQVHHKWQSYDIWFLRYQLQQTAFFFVVLDHFFALLRPPPPPLQKKMQKIKILKNEKSIYRCHPFTHVYQKSQYMIMMYASWDIECDIVFHHFGSFLCFYPTNNPENILNNVKNASRYYPFTHVYPKWRYDVWLLRYKAQQTEFFVVLVHFLPFELPNNLKNQKNK